MSSQVARKHHYVPRFLLRPWAVGGELRGYFWDSFRNEVRKKQRGVTAFCHELDLLSVSSSSIKPDALETRFFGTVDSLGADVVNRLRSGGVNKITAEQRVHFARLLLSLDARRPAVVSKLKHEGTEHLAAGLNSDPDVLAAFSREGIEEKPSDYWSGISCASLTDVALLSIQHLVDNAEVGGKLINYHWRVYELGLTDGTLILSDRPLVRIGAYHQPHAVWALPLSPRAVFVAAASEQTIANIDRQTPQRLRKLMNQSSLNQVDRYVFMVDETNLPLLNKNFGKS